MTFQQFITIIRIRKYSMFLIFFLTVAATVFISMNLPKTYKASASVVVNIKGVDLITGNKVKVQLNTHANIIKSKNVALKVVEKMALYSSSFYVDKFYKDNEGKGDIRDYIAELLQKDLSVFAIPGNNVITISFEATSPEFAAQIANEYVKAYIETSLSLDIDPSKRTAQWFQNQVDELRANLSAKRAEQIEFQKRSGIIEMDQGFDLDSARLTELNTQLFKAQTSLFDVSEKLKVIKEDLSNFNDVVDDENLESIRSELVRAEIEFYQVVAGLSKNHPDYKKLSSKVTSLRNLLKRETKLSYNRLLNSQTAYEARVQELELEIDKQKKQILTSREKLKTLEDLKTSVNEAESALSLAVTRLNEISLQGNSSESDISLLNEASIPTEHHKPKMILNVALGLILGFVLAVGITMIRELRVRKLRINDDVEVSVGLPVLGSLLDATTKR